jgi:hypothetical protein
MGREYPIGFNIPLIEMEEFSDVRFKQRAVINTLRTGSFKLFKRLFPGFLTILTL